MVPPPRCLRAHALFALLLIAGVIIACGGSDETTSADSTPGEAPAVPATDGSESGAADLRLDSPADGSTMDAAPNFGGIAGSREGDSREVTIEIWRGDEVSGSPIETVTTERSGQGAYSVTIGSPLDSGDYSARAEQVGSSGRVERSDVRRFTVDAGEPPMILAAGDIGGCGTRGDAATAALLDRLPGPVLTLGDHAYEYGTPAQFDCYDATWGRHKSRTRPVLGDHDYATADGEPYFDYFGSAAGTRGEGYYSYDVGDWHIVALNSNCDLLGGCDEGSAELDWLKEDLAANRASCTLAYFANAVFSSGAIHGNQTTPLPLWDELYAAGADVVLSGDDHIYERFAPQTPDAKADPENGIREFIVGTGGRSHYDFGEIQPNSQVRNNDTYGVLALTLLPDRYEWEFIPEDGRSFTDSGKARCH